MFLPTTDDKPHKYFNIFQDTFNYISVTIEKTYTNSSFYNLVNTNLRSFLDEIHNSETQKEINKKKSEIRVQQVLINGTTSNIETKTENISKPKNTQRQKDALNIELKGLTNQLQQNQLTKNELEQQLNKLHEKHKKEFTTEYIQKFSYYKSVKENLTKWFELVDIPADLANTIASFIADSVNPSRTNSVKDMFNELQRKLEAQKEKPSDNITKHTILEVIYLLKTHFKNYISEVETPKTDIVPSPVTQTTSDNSYSGDMEISEVTTNRRIGAPEETRPRFTD
jgi:hypothetical protein